MSDPETQAIVELQRRIRARLEALAFPNTHVMGNLERHLAEIAVLSRSFFEHTLPLFLTVSLEHRQAIARVAASIRNDLDELRDSLVDIEPDIRQLESFLNQNS